MSMPTPSYTSADTTDYAVEGSDFSFAGAFLRSATTGRRRRFLTLHYEPGQLDATTAGDLVTVYEGASGSAGTCSMTDWTTQTSGTYRFVDDDLELSVASIVAYGCDIRVIGEGI